jgi:hypothetical protein
MLSYASIFTHKTFTVNLNDYNIHCWLHSTHTQNSYILTITCIHINTLALTLFQRKAARKLAYRLAFKSFNKVTDHPMLFQIKEQFSLKKLFLVFIFGIFSLFHLLLLFSLKSVCAGLSVQLARESGFYNIIDIP